MTRIIFATIALSALTAGCGLSIDGIDSAPLCRDTKTTTIVVLNSCSSAPGCAICMHESASGSRSALTEACTSTKETYGADVVCVENCDSCPISEVR